MTSFDRLGLAVVGIVAALTRLPGLESRGQFDSDQGHDMLTLVAFTRDGVVPLLGPKTSVGEFHHGTFYYFLHFLVIMPIVGVTENPKPLPRSITESVLGKGGQPAHMNVPAAPEKR